MYRLYSLSINWGVDLPDMSSVDRAVGEIPGDWIRFNGHQWFVWTDAGRLELTAAVKAILRPSAQYVIVSIEPVAAQGLAPKWIWDWMNGKMQQQIQKQFTDGGLTPV